MNNRPSSPDAQPRLAPLALGILALSTCAAAHASASAEELQVGPWAARYAALSSDATYRKLLGLPPTPQGSTIVVQNCNDHGTGSLRAALASATNNDTLDMSALNCTVTLTTGELVVTQTNLSISGPGSDKLTIDGDLADNNTNRAFHHTGAGTLGLSGMTITNAKYVSPNDTFAQGGCILSGGAVSLVNAVVTNCFLRSGTNFIASGAGVHSNGLVLVNSTITGNFAIAGTTSGAGWGGGVYCHGAVTAKYSTISNNSTTGSSNGQGGGVKMDYGNAYFFDSTISGNTSARYAGLLIGNGPSNAAYTAKIFNSTISSNTATSFGGGMASQVNTTIANSTIAYNETGDTHAGAGARVFNAPINLQSSIVALNTNQSGLADLDVAAATTVSGANDLVTQGSGTLPPGTITSCPLLGRLSNNGGTTLTHRLLANSPALDAGNNNTGASGNGFANDQRGTGHVRVLNNVTDIGAFEYGGGVSDELFRSEFENRCN